MIVFLGTVRLCC